MESNNVILQYSVVLTRVYKPLQAMALVQLYFTAIYNTVQPCKGVPVEQHYTESLLCTGKDSQIRSACSHHAEEPQQNKET